MSAGGGGMRGSKEPSTIPGPLLTLESVHRLSRVSGTSGGAGGLYSVLRVRVLPRDGVVTVTVYDELLGALESPLQLQEDADLPRSRKKQVTSVKNLHSLFHENPPARGSTRIPVNRTIYFTNDVKGRAGISPHVREGL